MHQLLENMIEYLKCHKCQAIPGPNKDKRYSCHKNSHQLCESCRSKCKCDSSVMETPNLIVEKLLQDLPVYCRNYRRKCRQICDEVKDLEEHEKICDFRILYCENYRRKCCQTFFEVEDQEEHQKNCDYQILYCQNYKRKCVQPFYEVEDLEEHEKTCNLRFLYCQNKIRKCNEKFSEVEELEKHQKTCDFRLIFCPSNICRKINNGEMQFTSWVKHKTQHKTERYGIKYEWVELKQPTKIRLRLSQYRENGVLKYETLFKFFRLQNNVEFCIIGEVVGPVEGQVKKRVLIWICINGSPDEAKRYNYDMYYEGHYEPDQYKVSKSRNKVDDVMRFQVKTLEENPLDIMKGNTLKMVLLDDFLMMMSNKIGFVITIYDLEKPKKTLAQKLFGN